VQSALTNSVNNAFAVMAEQLDMCDIKKSAESLGVHRADGDELGTNPSDILGTNEIAPLTMAAAYAGIAANGLYCAPVAIDRIVDPEGTEITPPQANCTQALQPNIAATLAYAMLGPIEDGTATASNPDDDITHIGKTGTTDNEKDTWMVGASTAAATAVWVGNVSGNVSMTEIDPNDYAGSTVRHRIWRSVMTANDDVLGGGEFPEPDEALVDGSTTRFDSNGTSTGSGSDSGTGSGSGDSDGTTPTVPPATVPDVPAPAPTQAPAEPTPAPEPTVAPTPGADPGTGGAAPAPGQ